MYRSPRVFVALVVTAVLLAGGCTVPEQRWEETRPGPTPTIGVPTARPVTNPYAGQVPAFASPPAPHRVELATDGRLAPVLKTVPTQQPVVFITVDDGIVRLPETRALLEAAKVPISAFLISSVAAQDPTFFRGLQRQGVPIEAHTIDHVSLRGLPYEAQKHQICGSADQLAQLFGKRPTLFRPPYGEYDETTRRAAHDCGMKAIFYWRESVTRGHVYYQTPEKKLQPGDVILMHFRAEFVNDFLATLREIHSQGLTPALLEDYVS